MGSTCVPDIFMVQPFDLQTISRLNNCRFSPPSVTLFMRTADYGGLLTGQGHGAGQRVELAFESINGGMGPAGRSYLPTSLVVGGGMQCEHLTEI